MYPYIENIKKHPITAFFLIAFAISWIIWSIPLVIPLNTPAYMMLICVIGAFGPALSAVLIAKLLKPAQIAVPRWKNILRFAVLFCIILPFALFWPMLNGSLADPVFLLLCSILAALSAFVITRIFSRTVGVQDLMRSLGQWRVKPVWYLFALAVWPLLLILSSVIDLLYSGQSFSTYISGMESIRPLSAVILFFTILLIGGPLQEEPGWRGFALPRLQFLFNPIVASIILGFFWQFWHVPLYFTGFYPFDMADIIARFVWFLPGVLIVTWLYNRSRGSLLILVLFHASIDAFPQILPAQTANAGNIFNVLLLILAVIFVFTDKMWKKRTPVPDNSQSKE
ncbi:Abortive infection protein [Methanocorpusculum labreanum Z]|uniref:Abortive infection protein n=1 Tax=Methanocorpusculum labreanum (strain ATCC 43576 / DSM 4855 / Z) TaxID=410358 RepID=A2SSP7_METLZ|nr:type II CAAX endopeptidase family protein [Methanocorpusculum labreanum]ABN07353.1 Abortive infection protein [Methanocorpusculum labreanum Z]